MPDFDGALLSTARPALLAAVFPRAYFGDLVQLLENDLSKVVQEQQLGLGFHMAHGERLPLPGYLKDSSNPRTVVGEPGPP